MFDALELVRPTAAFPYVGLAMACMNAGRPDEAVAVVDRGLRRVPREEQGQLHAFRALALQLAGRAAESARALACAGEVPLAMAMRGDKAPQAEAAWVREEN